MRVLTLLAVPAVALPLVAVAPATAQAPEAPRTRVVLLALDGLRPDELTPLQMPFLSGLAAGGSLYTEGRAVFVPETIPNHVSMVTGAYPDRTGIVANTFPDVGGDPDDDEVPVDEPEPTFGAVEAGDPALLQADSLFTLVERQCPQLVTAAVTSKDYLYTVMDHDRTGDGEVDADDNFANVDDPFFVPGLGLTLDERTAPQAVAVAQQLDPDLLFVNLGSVDRIGHVDPVGGTSTPLPTGSAPVLREAQLRSTDTLVRALVTALQADGRWEATTLLVTADHSMDWSFATSTVSLSPQIEADPELAGRFVIAQNGGAALYSLRDRRAPDAPRLLAKLRELAVATDGVDEALYRRPNPVDATGAPVADPEEHWVGRVHPDWHATHPRNGDLIVTVEDGRRITEPSSFSNPIPGNHGMASTLRIPVVVAGGQPGLVAQRVDPGRPVSAFERLPEQAEQVDLAPTAAWLLGIDPPEGGFDGRVLEEAFTSRPAPTCVVQAGGPAAEAPTPSVSPAPAPGTAAAPARGRSLPATGPSWTAGVPALLAVGAALALRRRRTA